MADRVQFILDRMAPLFRQLVELNVFTSDEMKFIVKKRTDYEYILRRRELKVSDFYNYLQYELNLNQLRVIRCRREGLDTSKDKKVVYRTINSAFIRHISYIFERTVRRFPDDMDTWADYISFLKANKCISQFNMVIGRALSLHPKNEEIWIQAAVHELSVNNNAQAARILLQRALRTNKKSRRLWIKYFEMECWYELRAFERNSVLGLEHPKLNERSAPMVVYQHATAAISEEDFAYILHSTFSEIGESAALLNVKEFIETDISVKYGGKTSYWSYLCLFKIRHELELSLVGTKKRVSMKRKQDDLMSMDTIVHRTCTSLDTLATLMVSAVDHCASPDTGGSTPDHCASIGGVKTLPSHASELIDLCLVFRNCLLTVCEGVLSLSGDLEASMENEQQMSQESLQEISAAVSGIFRVVEVLRGRLKGLSLPGIYMAHLKLVEHYIYLLQKCFSAEAGELTASYAAAKQWLLEQRSAVTADHPDHCLLWVDVASALFQHALALEAATTGVTMGLEADVDDGHRRSSETCSFATSLLQAAPAVAGSETGLSLIASALDYCSIARVEGAAETCVAAVLQVIASTHCPTRSRGDWCCRYMRLRLMQATSSDISVLQSAFDCVKTSLSSPHLSLGTDLTDFYTLVLDYLLVRIRNLLPPVLKSDKTVQFAKLVAENAVERYPETLHFWDALEEVERRTGDLKAASHVRWRQKVK